MAQKQLTKGYIGYLKGEPRYLPFQYNPKEVKRARRATYAKNAASLADFPNSTDRQAPAVEWIRNEAEDVAIELIFQRNGEENVEDELKRLDKMMQPDRSTGEPKDLVLVMGVRSDRVRIIEKDVTEELFAPDLKVQRARVSLKLIAKRSRSG